MFSKGSIERHAAAIVFLWVLAVCSAAPAISANNSVEPIDVNGTYWGHLTASDKQHLVVGFLVGFDSGYSMGYVNTLHAADERAKSQATGPGSYPTPTLYAESISKGPLTKQPRFDEAVEYYVKGVDSFYREDVLLLRVPVSEVVLCLVDRTGHLCDLTAKFWKSHPPGSGL